MYMLYIYNIYIYITFNSSSYISSTKSNSKKNISSNVESSVSIGLPAHIVSSKSEVISHEKIHYSAHGNIYI